MKNVTPVRCSKNEVCPYSIKWELGWESWTFRFLHLYGWSVYKIYLHIWWQGGKCWNLLNGYWPKRFLAHPLLLYLTPTLFFWRTGSKKRSLGVKQFHLLFSVICRWIWVGEEDGVEGCTSKISAQLWFHDDLDGAASVFCHPCVGSRWINCPRFLIIGKLWAEHRAQLVWELTALNCVVWLRSRYN